MVTTQTPLPPSKGCSYSTENWASSVMPIRSPRCTGRRQLKHEQHFPKTGYSIRVKQVLQAFDPTFESVAEVRAFVRRTALSWDVDEDDAVLVVNELATNASIHAGSPYSVSLRLDEDWLTVEVVDGSDALPEKREASPTERGGRGLTIVEALSESWGVRELHPGKALWATLYLHGS